MLGQLQDSMHQFSSMAELKTSYKKKDDNVHDNQPKIKNNTDKITTL